MREPAATIHPVRERTFSLDPAGILPPITPDNEPFWRGLQAGRLTMQGCASCGALRYPVAPVCAACGSTEIAWRGVSGRGTVFSWVRYHRAYLPEFADVVPYMVGLIELEEGVRVFARLLDWPDDPAIGQPVRLVIERWPDGRCVPAFTLSGDT